MQRERRVEIRPGSVPGPVTVLSSIGKAVASSPKAMSVLALWGFGIFVLLYAAAPAPTSEADRARFHELLQSSNNVKGYDEALDAWYDASDQLYYAKGWFWWLSSEASEQVYYWREQEARTRGVLDKLEAEREVLRREAFNVVGLFSEYGVEEARQLFWDCFEKGKGFARRSTFFEVVFGAMTGRDETITSLIARAVIGFLIYVPMGLFGSLISFTYYLFGMVYAYKASLLSGGLFFLLALLGGSSMCALYIFLVYGSVATVGYAIVYSKFGRLEAGPGGQRQEPGRLHYD
eukprot:m.340276 g.340276  ORF g.340276 m.340276 type:complete len:291 (+) comp19221_c0_seq1:433-1305(+)